MKDQFFFGYQRYDLSKSSCLLLTLHYDDSQVKRILLGYQNLIQHFQSNLHVIISVTYCQSILCCKFDILSKYANYTQSQHIDVQLYSLL